jgi:hypothetical protein
MKNISRIGRLARDGESCSDQNNRGIAATSWNFQASAAALRGGAGSLGKNLPSVRAFRALGQRFFDVESRREDIIEGSVFGLIGALSLWPMIMAVQALLALIR